MTVAGADTEAAAAAASAGGDSPGSLASSPDGAAGEGDAEAATKWSPDYRGASPLSWAEATLFEDINSRGSAKSYFSCPAASADGAGGIERGVEEADLAPFFCPLVITALQATSPVQCQPRSCVPVLEHILATAMDHRMPWRTCFWPMICLSHAHGTTFQHVI